MIKFTIKTFGCKVNQYESQAIRESLQAGGAQEIEKHGEPADLVIVNTCTVTRDADRSACYWIRRLRRENPDSRLAVTGCLAERDRAILEGMKAVDFIFTNQEKHRIADFLIAEISKPKSVGMVTGREMHKGFLPLSITTSDGKTRAIVKIQDGCNNACSYCKVVLARGPSRSRSLGDILAEVRRLADNGYKEIVLTGIQLGSYRDGAEDHPNSLVQVIERCSKIQGIARIRLSSIELTDIRDPLIRSFCDIPKLCPHLHIPIQSGSDSVLKNMNRRYSAGDCIELVEKMRSKIPDFCLTTDVIVGFPGESEDDFGESLKVLETLRPVKSHVFPYSPREGTRAALLRGLPRRVVRDRVNRMIERMDRISREVREAFIGKTVEVLVEHRNPRSRYREGRTANGLRVFFDFPKEVQGCIIPVALRELFEDGIAGTWQNTGKGDADGFFMELDR
jgi:threonylcarbamoyladenosine tRNA methylthiotransferase MtaB